MSHHHSLQNTSFNTVNTHTVKKKYHQARYNSNNSNKNMFVSISSPSKFIKKTPSKVPKIKIKTNPLLHTKTMTLKSTKLSKNNNFSQYLNKRRTTNSTLQKQNLNLTQHSHFTSRKHRKHPTSI